MTENENCVNDELQTAVNRAYQKELQCVPKNTEKMYKPRQEEWNVSEIE